MNHLAEYYSDDESPFRRNPEEELSLNNSDKGQTANEISKEIQQREGRRDSEYWTDESANGSSSSNADSSVESGSRKSGSVSSLHPPPSKKALLISPPEHLVQSDFGASISPSRNQNRLFASKSALYITQSQTSLVSYGEQEDEEDQFVKADRKAVASKQTEEKGSSESTNREPKPPPGHEDSRSPDEIAVDSAVEEGLRELERQHIDQNLGSLTPKSAEGNDSPQIHDEPMEIRLPPSPTAKCSTELEARFRGFFEKKAQGADLNALIQKRRDFKNPSMYEKLIEKFEVDELGSNFAPSVFDPHGFTKDCFYDQISVLQKEAMEKYNATVEKKTVTVSNKGTETKRKSRFEGAKK
ncbi:transcriptional regulator HCNGP [Loa loa]|uniref:Transcriptional regulator HCNGP n=1 Tax=Loa loa TaxID=7209 RepID=A0A1I7V7M1_LOALO|nr:transcriptional regulator HCNGP [Loa loa]EFO20506.2 transcriptional regulator HCNGP [Loa loa]